MSDETFAELLEFVVQALAYERGKGEDYRITRVAAHKPPKSVIRNRSILTRNILKPDQKYKNALKKK